MFQKLIQNAWNRSLGSPERVWFAESNSARISKAIRANETGSTRWRHSNIHENRRNVGAFRVREKHDFRNNSRLSVYRQQRKPQRVITLSEIRS